MNIYTGVELVVNRMRDVAAGCFFAFVAILVSLVFAGEQLHKRSGLMAIPVIDKLRVSS